MNAMRYGEFGTQTPANIEVFEREIPPPSQWPLTNTLDPILIRKNVLQAAFTPLDWLVKPVIEGYFGPFDGFENLLKLASTWEQKDCGTLLTNFEGKGNK